MEQETLDELIKALHQLHIIRADLHTEERRILQQEQDTLRQIRVHTGTGETRDRRSDRGIEGRVTPTQDNKVPHQETQAEATRGSHPPVEEEPQPGVFRVGQRAYIHNRVRHVPPQRRATPLDRACVVQRVSRNRVDIVTYNGHETWRAPGNLRHLSEQEHRDIQALTEQG